MKSPRLLGHSITILKLLCAILLSLILILDGVALNIIYAECKVGA